MDDMFLKKTGIVDLDNEQFAKLCESVFISESYPTDVETIRFRYKGKIFIVEQHGDDINLELLN